MADIQVTGNVGQSELKFTQGGAAYLRFSVADNHRKKTQAGWEDDGTTWWNITAWDKQAEALAEAVVKGARVIVTGTIRSREYEKDGETRTAYGINARTVGVVPKLDTPRPSTPPAADPWGAGVTSDAAPF